MFWFRGVAVDVTLSVQDTDNSPLRPRRAALSVQDTDNSPARRLWRPVHGGWATALRPGEQCHAVALEPNQQRDTPRDQTRLMATHPLGDRRAVEARRLLELLGGEPRGPGQIRVGEHGAVEVGGLQVGPVEIGVLEVCAA